LAALLWHHPALRDYVPDEIANYEPPSVAAGGAAAAAGGKPRVDGKATGAAASKGAGASVSILLNLIHRTGTPPVPGFGAPPPAPISAPAPWNTLAADGGLAETGTAAAYSSEAAPLLSEAMEPISSPHSQGGASPASSGSGAPAADSDRAGDDQAAASAETARTSQ
jgi:hypothetical protein